MVPDWNVLRCAAAGAACVAIGTIEVSRLGQRASHGCERLDPAHAATLFALVQQQRPGNTRIVIGR